MWMEEIPQKNIKKRGDKGAPAYRTEEVKDDKSPLDKLSQSLTCAAIAQLVQFPLPGAQAQCENRFPIPFLDP
jgi:hypothetical protein